MFIKKYGDIVVSIFFAAISIIMIVAAKALPKSTVMDIGPDFMPMVVGVLTLVLSIILLITSLKGFKENAEKVEAVKAKALAEGKGDPYACDYVRVALCFIAITIYAFVLKTIGFVICTIVFLPFVMYVMSPKDKRTVKDLIILIVIGVVFTFVVYYLFRLGFKILLPTGLLTGIL